MSEIFFILFKVVRDLRKFKFFPRVFYIYFKVYFIEYPESLQNTRTFYPIPIWKIRSWNREREEVIL